MTSSRRLGRWEHSKTSREVTWPFLCVRNPALSAAEAGRAEQAAGRQFIQLRKGSIPNIDHGSRDKRNKETQVILD